MIRLPHTPDYRVNMARHASPFFCSCCGRPLDEGAPVLLAHMVAAPDGELYLVTGDELDDHPDTEAAALCGTCAPRVPAEYLSEE